MNDSVDVALVGDSAGMVVHGYDSTSPVTLAQMVGHCAAVVRGTTKPLIVADLPFASYLTVDDALRSAARLVQEGGASAVKLEGGRAQAAKIAAIVREGIPVMGHVGLLPQTCTATSGYRLAGRSAHEAVAVLEDALAVQVRLVGEAAASGSCSAAAMQRPPHCAGRRRFLRRVGEDPPAGVARI